MRIREVKKVDVERSLVIAGGLKEWFTGDALKTKRNRKNANLNVTRGMIEDILFDFKK